MREPRTHFADLLYGRPCCGSDSKLVTRAEGEATCKRCLTVMNKHPCPVHGDANHGGEAEELRKGIEKLMAEYWIDDREGVDELVQKLSRLADTVNARDSLAWLERHDEKWEARVDELQARVAVLESAEAQKEAAHG